MNHIVYLSPNAEELSGGGRLRAIMHDATIDPVKTLDTLRKRSDEEVMVFDSVEGFAAAFNNDTVSDQGYILIIDDNISENMHLLAVIRDAVQEKGVKIQTPGQDPVTVIDLLPSNELDYDKAQDALNDLHADLPVYVVVSNRNGDWFEEKVRRVIVSNNGGVQLQVEDGSIIDAREAFVENLRTVADIVETLGENAIKTFHEQYA